MRPSHPPIDLSRPVSCWQGQDLLDGQAVGSLTVILRTRGCRWRSCKMCGYALEGAEATGQDLLNQMENALSRAAPARMVKIYTSGSFLDPVEVPPDARDRILEMAASWGAQHLVLESRPEFITSESVSGCVRILPTTLGIGLETASDLIRERIINKGFSFQDFAGASRVARDGGATVKAYLLMKPPHLSEEEALADTISSIRKAEPHSDLISLNLCNVQRGTPLERIWARGGFRPPWLWSAVQVLKGASGRAVPVICDPVGAGSSRGPHNCGKCDSDFASAIRRHALEQDGSVFDDLNCRCHEVWRAALRLEQRAFGSPLGMMIV
ncbi:MAG: hypothetical protein A4E45_02174 [Methanosaeta sp. PtaB.Bin039]|nr:MAG: hypothetical protein A4E45_02174 [Methanosaeta sp. PtaB.Bin039]OPY46868.1 MAG: hypothetical protein A4E47_00446 [Methanosaeta sp. PtaU1.Bin028]HOT06111.1 archaeosine biosynthesis radical SAM protein RaSEA [Methanotrichaceae archaeon]HQF16239.1 archaeosine biosynthesis radical SAM protein RaSEA [Methanotrichaceae archaeon]HQI90011.1 archaeosine biosynthesis radical SAM protein RaSEA [Methanotrichaceae archaeon]